MAVQEGDKLPEATFIRMGDGGPEEVALASLTKGKRIIIFAVPGAFTPTCDSSHLPSFIRTGKRFEEKGIDLIVCVSVNDPHVMKRWGKESGADAAGILMLSDADASYTKAVGMEFSAPQAGFYDRSHRYAMLVEDGVVVKLAREEGPGVCEATAGEAMLAEIQ